MHVCAKRDLTCLEATVLVIGGRKNLSYIPRSWLPNFVEQLHPCSLCITITVVSLAHEVFKCE